MFGASAARTSTRSCSLSPSWLLAGRGFRYARMDRRHPRVAASHGKVQSRQTCTHRGAERVCLWTPLQLHNGYISIRDGIWVTVLSLSHVWAGPTSAWLWAGPGRGPVARSHAPLHTTLCSCCRACCGTGAARRCWSSVFWAVAQRAALPPRSRRPPRSPLARAPRRLVRRVPLRRPPTRGSRIAAAPTRRASAAGAVTPTAVVCDWVCVRVTPRAPVGPAPSAHTSLRRLHPTLSSPCISSRAVPVGRPFVWCVRLPLACPFRRGLWSPPQAGPGPSPPPRAHHVDHE